MALKLSNNGLSVLAGAIAASATTLSLQSGHGPLFPTLSAGDWFPLTLTQSSGGFEVIRVTARSGDNLTVTRAQEGTTALAFVAGDRAELRLTAAAIGELQTNISLLLPTGAGPIPWSRPTEPAGWIFCDGRVLLAASPYAALRAAYIADSFPYGEDGSGNPKIPDMRGRVPAGVDNMGGTTAYRITTGRAEIDGTVLGAAGGWEGQTLSADQMPAHTHGVTDPTHAHSVYDPTHAHAVYDPSHVHNTSGFYSSGVAGSNNFSAASPVQNKAIRTTEAAVTGIGIYGAATGISLYGAGTGVSIQSAGSDWEHSITQPTIMLNYILKT
jgi:microcystin-dependent protein